MITAHDLIYRPLRCQRDLLHVKQLTFAAGQFHALIGANGAGKSTLLRALSGDLPTLHGQVFFDGTALQAFDMAELALRRAVLPQSLSVAFSVAVREVVAFGRNVYHQRPEAKEDEAVIDEVMAWLSIRDLAAVNYQRLSGGEMHRCHIARVLAQLLATPAADLTGKILFLDEPTNHLDVKHQYALMALLRDLQARGLTIVCVLHDLALALNYADYLLLLRAGEDVGYFRPQDLVASGALDQTYDLAMNAHFSEKYQRFVVMPQITP